MTKIGANQTNNLKKTIAKKYLYIEIQDEESAVMEVNF